MHPGFIAILRLIICSTYLTSLAVEMTDRHQPHLRIGGGGGIARARGSGTTSSSVRRNLFQSQLTRRPTASSTTSAETIRLETDGANEESDDIVVRDQDGEVECGDPPTPPVDDPEEEGLLDPTQENERERQRLAEAVKQHQIDQNSVPAQPEGTSPTTTANDKVLTHREELLEAVRASLRAKVAALAEDNWMYEREDFPKRQ